MTYVANCVLLTLAGAKAVAAAATQCAKARSWKDFWFENTWDKPGS